jgi:hypothetical protein
MPEPVRFILMYLVFPLWVAAGFADWICHRRTGIATTSGLKENLLHWALYAEMGVAVAAVALLQINAAVLLLGVTLLLLHELTVYWDLDYSVPRREVGPFEQMVHSFMELLPLASLALLAVLAWPQALAMAGLGSELADWSLRWKERPLPPSGLAAGILPALIFNLAPLLQETYACVKARARIPPNPAPR